MTFDELLRLDDAALNMAIDTQVYGYVWEAIPKPTQDGWWGAWYRCENAHGTLTYSSVPFFHHTTSWERTMALSLCYGIGVAPGLDTAGHWVTYSSYIVTESGLRRYVPIHGLPPDDPQAIRVAICRLALWQAFHEKESSP